MARLVLGYVLAVLAFIPFVARAFDPHKAYTLAVLLTTDVPGTLQVYYDIGKGLREPDSASAPLTAGRREYVLPLASGQYRMIRIDPGTAGGRYTIERVIIRGPDGSTRPIALTDLSPAHQLSLVERTAEHLVADSPAGSNDPQLQYVPAQPLSLVVPEQRPERLAGRLLGYWIVAVLLIALVERMLRPVAPAVTRGLRAAARRSEAHPRTAVVGAAAIATLIATYPIVFLNRSLVTPNNGGTAMLYDWFPFTPGAHDSDIEDVRGSDVYAMMVAFLPYVKAQDEALAHREVPLWNRFNAGGRPLWGQGQTFIGDPLHWLTFRDADRGQDLKFVAHRFVFAAGVGIAALLGGCGWLGAAAAAVAAPFAGYYSFRFNHDAVFALSYAPWVLVAWFALAAAPARFQMARAALLMTAASALVLLASPPKEAVVVLVGCHASGLVALLLRGRTAPGLWKRVGVAALAGVATIAITAPHWIVFLDTLRSSQTLYDRPSAALFPLAVAPQILLGTLSPVLLIPVFHIAALPPLLGAFSAPGALVRRPAMLACFAIAVCLVALGFGAIPEAWLIRVPLVANISQINNTTVTAALVLLCVACAAGVGALLTESLFRAFSVSAFMGLISAWLLRDAVRRSVERFDPWFIGLLLAGAVAVPLCAWAARRTPERLLPKVSLLCLGALLLLPGGLHVETGVAKLDRLLAQPRLRADLEAASPAVDAVRRVMTEPARTAGLGRVLLAGSQALYGLEGVGGPDALVVSAYEELVDAAPIDRPDGPRAAGGWVTIVAPESVERLAPLLDLLNVGFVLARTDAAPPGLVELPKQGLDQLRVFRRPTVWPRAFFVDGVSTYAEPRALLDRVAAHRRPLAAVQSSDGEALEATRRTRAPSADAVPAQSYALTANATSFVVRAPGAGVAVLTETFLPGDFQASLNGQRVPYFRVNHAFKAVAIPSAGEWAVKFEYRPRRWSLSLAIAAFGLLVVAALVLLALRSRDRVEAAAR